MDSRDEGIARPLLSGSPYEPEEMAFVRSVLRPGDTFVDVGANVGQYSTLAASIVGPEGRVFAFEPDPRNFRLLSRGVEANGLRNVTLERLAVSDRAGAARLYRNLLNHGNHRMFDGRGSSGSRSVRTIRLDDYFADRGITVDFLKMDIEGAEHHAFRGMMRLLEASLGRITVLTEIWPRGMQKAGGDPLELLRMLEGVGFGIRAVDGRSMTVPEALDSCPPEGYINLILQGTGKGGPSNRAAPGVEGLVRV